MDRVLICGTNWLGDCIMSMPSLQVLKQRRPNTHLTLLAKPGMVPLWQMHSAVDAIVPIAQGRGGTRRTVRVLRQQLFDRAVIFPNSFRSALLPFMGGVPRRMGVASHGRALLLTERRPGRQPGDASHQVWEYYRLLGLDKTACCPKGDPSTSLPPSPAGLWRAGGMTVPESVCLSGNGHAELAEASPLSPPDGLCNTLKRDEPVPPRITPPPSARDKAAQLLAADDNRPWIAMLPGAARGDSKRWPPQRFADVAKGLVESHSGRIALFGTAAEASACDHIAAAVGDAACNLAGKTSLTVLAAALARCGAAVSNDSGGMHLATAVGTPVVAIFGLTDPDLTGPLGEANRVICGAPPEQRTRDVPRESAEAAAALHSVQPERVLAEARGVLEDS